MQLAIVILFVLMTAFLCLFVSKAVDCKNLQEENEQYQKREDRIAYQKMEDKELTVESAMEVIRYNGYFPEYDGEWITFMSQGERYYIDPERFPVVMMMKFLHGLTPEICDMDLIHKAAHKVSDEIIMGKVLFTGEEEDGIAIQIVAIEPKSEHLKSCLSRYVELLEHTQSAFITTYNKMFSEKEMVSAVPQQFDWGTSVEKKVVS